MLSTIRALAEQIAPNGWDPPAIDRLIARIEDDGTVSREERASIAELLTGDRFLRHARSRLGAYAAFADLAALRPAPGPRLFGGARPDLDVLRYRRHVEILAGERPTEAGARFRDRWVASPNHQLDEVVEWLARHYLALGLEHRRQAVRWRGRVFQNLIVTIPGAARDAVVLADHYDVADKEPIEPRNRAQLWRDHRLDAGEIAARMGAVPIGHAVPGADDNASATAALMELGALLRGRLDAKVELGRTIQLVHLVGEELPGDGFGARAFIREADREIAAAVVLDMIGVDRGGKRKVQLNPGRPRGSLELAAQAKHVIRSQGLDLVPVLRPFGSRKSFLHQTDGVHFSRAGIPVLLLNEHLNDDRDLYRVGYHDEFDVTRLMSFDFAAHVARTALELVYQNALPLERR